MTISSPDTFGFSTRWGPVTPEELGVLAGVPFIGAEAYLLMGVKEKDYPARSALRKVGDIIKAMEEAVDAG
jgi:hypothetical protein